MNLVTGWSFMKLNGALGKFYGGGGSSMEGGGKYDQLVLTGGLSKAQLGGKLDRGEEFSEAKPEGRDQWREN